MKRRKPGSPQEELLVVGLEPLPAAVAGWELELVQETLTHLAHDRPAPERRARDEVVHAAP